MGGKAPGRVGELGTFHEFINNLTFPVAVTEPTQEIPARVRHTDGISSMLKVKK